MKDNVETIVDLKVVFMVVPLWARSEVFREVRVRAKEGCVIGVRTARTLLSSKRWGIRRAKLKTRHRRK